MIWYDFFCYYLPLNVTPKIYKLGVFNLSTKLNDTNDTVSTNQTTQFTNTLDRVSINNMYDYKWQSNHFHWSLKKQECLRSSRKSMTNK